MAYCTVKRHRLILFFSLIGAMCASSLSFADGRIDPTRPVNLHVVSGVIQEKNQPTNLILRAIYRHGTKKWAIVDDSIVEEGQPFFEYTVKSIMLNRVVLTGPDGEIELKLLGEDVKYIRDRR